MKLTQLFSAPATSGIVSVLPGRSLTYSLVMDGEVAFSLRLQKSENGGATWTTVATYDDEISDTVTVSILTLFRFVCLEIDDDSLVTAVLRNSIYGVLDRQVATVDYVWDYAVQTGAIGAYELPPSHAVPVDAWGFQWARQEITPLSGAGVLSLGIDSDADAIEDGGTVGNAVGFFPSPQVIGDGQAIKANITGDTLGAGKVCWTLTYFYSA